MTNDDKMFMDIVEGHLVGEGMAAADRILDTLVSVEESSGLPVAKLLPTVLGMRSREELIALSTMMLMGRHHDRQGEQ